MKYYETKAFDCGLIGGAMAATIAAALFSILQIILNENDLTRTALSWAIMSILFFVTYRAKKRELKLLEETGGII